MENFTDDEKMLIRFMNYSKAINGSIIVPSFILEKAKELELRGKEMSEKKDDDFKEFSIEKMIADLAEAGKRGAESGNELNKLFGNTISDGLLQGLPNGISGHSDITSLMKTTVIILQLKSKLAHLESLLGPITMIVRNDSIPEFQAIDQIKDILKDIEVQKIECNGDCNNCDREH